MAGNTLGRMFKITTWGESHGEGLGVIVDGCPAGLPLDDSRIQEMLDRRRPGRGPSGTTRKEKDRARIMSGVFEGVTTGTPIHIMAENRDADSSAYEPYANLFRPGHGDFTYTAKYGVRDWRGGGRASARETLARVAGGAVARELLSPLGVRVAACTLELGGIRAGSTDPAAAAADPLGCADPEASRKMAERVAEVKKQGDSLGGVVEVRAAGVPPGLGEPVFDKLDADIAGAMMSIGAVKGVAIGDGFEAAGRLGSENNDAITPRGFATNHAGGVLAGISNGDDIVVRVAVKPIPSIAIEKETLNLDGSPATVATRGRHDIAAIPRVNVVCEAMLWLVLADHWLRQKAIS